MFGIGSTEFLVIILVALMVLGPRSLAKVTRTVGKYVGEFRRMSTDFQRTLNAEVAAEESREARSVARRAEAARAGQERRAQQAAASGSAGGAPAADTAAAPAAPAGDGATGKAAPASSAAPTAPAGSGRADDDDVLAPPPGSPLDQALKKASAEATGREPGNGGEGGRA